MRLPTFLIIGAMKAATTSLHAYLSEHPQLYLPGRKEIDFFAADSIWNRGLDWYSAQFDNAGPDVVAIGEASPSYAMCTFYPGAPERIAATIPDARLIYLVRHPIERMRSNYLHALASGVEHRPIGTALSEDPRYLDASRYGMQLAAYAPHFHRDQILVLTTEELRSHRQPTLDRVHTFLGVDPHAVDVSPGELHATADKTIPTWWAAALRLPGDPAPVSARVLRNALRPAQLAALAATHPRRAALRARYDAGTSRLVTRPVRVGDAALSAALTADLQERLAPDVSALRVWLGPDFDGWGIA